MKIRQFSAFVDVCARGLVESQVGVCEYQTAKAEKANMSELTNGIISEVKKVICGKDEIIKMVLTGILSKGHILIEDVPGVGKTSLVLAFSKATGMNFGRVQFTPDVLPSDITGFSIFDKASASMRYQQGLIFHNLFLADELNRASTRTQSALLEAMEERQVTVDGTTYGLPNPFVVVATQNPTGAAGTSLLPDSQMDRFIIRISMGYPSKSSEKEMILGRKGGKDPIDTVRPLCNAATIASMQEEVSKVYIHDKIVEYIVELVHLTRNNKDLARGASPRATLALADMAKALAFISDRNYVTPADVQACFAPVMSHRVILSPEAEIAGKSMATIMKETVKGAVPPKV